MPKTQVTYSWETPPDQWRGLSPYAAWRGRVEAIYVASKPSAGMTAVQHARALADRGLEGDRFFRASWRAANRPDKAVSLIEAETLELAARELGTEPIAEKTRRNIVTRGVPLIELLDREFTVGGVLMRGIRLFEPCAHLEKVAKVPGIFKALEHRSGLKAAILSDGIIRVGDSLETAQQHSYPPARP